MHWYISINLQNKVSFDYEFFQKINECMLSSLNRFRRLLRKVPSKILVHISMGMDIIG